MAMIDAETIAKLQAENAALRVSVWLPRALRAAAE
jgi:hypothetical protein